MTLAAFANALWYGASILLVIAVDLLLLGVILSIVFAMIFCVALLVSIFRGELKRRKNAGIN